MMAKCGVQFVVAGMVVVGSMRLGGPCTIGLEAHNCRCDAREVAI